MKYIVFVQFQIRQIPFCLFYTAQFYAILLESGLYKDRFTVQTLRQSHNLFTKYLKVSSLFTV